MSDFLTQQSAGAAGFVVETGTTAITGDFCEILVLEAATFALITEAKTTGDAMTGFAIAAGTVLKGKFSAFTLTSGKVRATKSIPLGQS